MLQNLVLLFKVIKCSQKFHYFYYENISSCLTDFKKYLIDLYFKNGVKLTIGRICQPCVKRQKIKKSFIPQGIKENNIYHLLEFNPHLPDSQPTLLNRFYTKRFPLARLNSFSTNRDVYYIRQRQASKKLHYDRFCVIWPKSRNGRNKMLRVSPWTQTRGFYTL